MHFNRNFDTLRYLNRISIVNDATASALFFYQITPGFVYIMYYIPYEPMVYLVSTVKKLLPTVNSLLPTTKKFSTQKFI
ncbi:hypothetical protein BpHYR1_004747 [Brachionus plicatilis]|uniref:Uncharacterized protein n=1 Tax=Brachionus plicatilis TaxID=10195 RepID=A0A3M7PNQ5_BRAPC|nr:hypothetical protein BpHYR1_004747 [Brachionus plicatilis]